MQVTEKKTVAIIGAGIFGLSLAVALRSKGYTVTVFDRNAYDETDYDPEGEDAQAASVDLNKILRASYGTKLHYQRLALESRQAWLACDKGRGISESRDQDDQRLFVNGGMLRVQPTDKLGELEKETLANLERDGLRHTQFVKSNPEDRQRAESLGWSGKLLNFEIPGTEPRQTYDAVLDSLAGFVRCSNACAYWHKIALADGVRFCFGKEGAVESLVKAPSTMEPGKEKVTGIRTEDGSLHTVDTVVVAAGSFSTQVLPELSYHLESSAGSVATFKIDRKQTDLWDKYSPDKFPVITWKATPRDKAGKDTGSIYVLPRTPQGYLKIGYRGIKFTNFQPAPKGTPFTQDGKWSVPLPVDQCKALPKPAIQAISEFVSIFLPEFEGVPFSSTKLCWYTDSLDNSFVIDYVPDYAEKSVFVCTGGSGHGAKFLPVLGEHAADIFENGDKRHEPNPYVKETPRVTTRSPNVVDKKDIDDTTLFYNTHKDQVRPLTPEVERKLVRKNFWCLLLQTWWISFLIHLDKSTLSSASTMGVFRDVAMSKNEYNRLFIFFYLGYMIALWPGAWLAQRIGHKHFITGSLLLWALLIGVHPAVTTGKQMMATESQIVPSTTMLHQAFFPPRKSPWVQLLWWAFGSVANVLLTMISYQLIQDDNHGTLAGSLASWKWLHIVCCILTFCVCVPLMIFLPNTPLDAKWLSPEEKVHTIEIIRNTHAGVKNSTFKWAQVREMVTDPKSWLFIFHMFFNELPNNTSQQLPLIIVGFGFTPAESALFNIIKPLWGLLLILVSAAMLYGTRLGTGYTCALSYIPCLIGGIIELAAPWSNKVALVVGTQISTFKPSYLLGLSWAGTTTTGYTKRLTLMSSCVVAASVANMISPEFWKSKYQPRYRLPWAFMTAFWAISPTMCIIIRLYLQYENRRRQRLLEQQESDSDREDILDTDGRIVKIDGHDFDATDRTNLKFRYPL
ncbi:hypothetical protein KXX47_003454 [Aspergillus fumigatus]|nr:hypothetical protein KXX47_003454 [Aspergillus fumigatus]